MSVSLDCEKLRSIRKMRNYTQEMLAELTGVSDRYIRRMESGGNANPTLSVLYPLCQALRCGLDDLVKAADPSE